MHRATSGLVVLVLLAAAAAYQFQLGPRWFGWEYPSPITAPAQVEPPPGLSLPDVPAAVPVARTTPGHSVDPVQVRRALRTLVRRRALGPRVAIDVNGLLDGSAVYRRGPRLVTPASTMKLLTSAAALSVLGPQHTFTTAVVAEPRPQQVVPQKVVPQQAVPQKAVPRKIVLVGGGDPLLARESAGSTVYPARADLDTLARATAKKLSRLGRTRIRLGYDDSLFTGPSVNPRWGASYIPDNVVSPITALWVDEGREVAGLSRRNPDPALAAAQAFATALAAHKITVVGKIASTIASVTADRLAVVESAPLAQIVAHIIEVSDNEGAETLARHVAIAVDQPASFEGGAVAVRAALSKLGISTERARIVDGSGLSRANRLDPVTILSVLEVASSPDHPELRPVVADLPVAGFNGSLTYRFQEGATAGLGTVRAKTGTLTGVHGLAGLVTSVDGAVMSFVALADRVQVPRTQAARDTLDEIAAALAGCACASTP